MLQIEGVSKQFASRILFQGASAHLRPGTRTGLVGPNGVGKTTLIRMILGEESPDKGIIRKRPLEDPHQRLVMRRPYQVHP